jgi:phosphohistidine phosphatase
VNELVEKVNIDNMPTCGIFAININIDKWSDFKEGKKEFLFCDYPKLV